MKQGDRVGYGPVRRQHVAEVLVQAIHCSEAAGLTLEVFSTQGERIADWSAAFATLTADQPPALDGATDETTLPIEREPERVRSDLDRLQAK